MQFLTLPVTDRFSKIYCVAFGSDLFHEVVSVADLRAIFEVMKNSTHHLFELVTKRIERAHRLKLNWPDNVLLGVVIESADYVSRLDYLREIPARFKFLSAAPLLGPLGDIDLTGIDQVGAVQETWGLKRPCKQQWIDDLREQCERQGAEFVTDAYGWRVH
jgi:protein gp37